MEAFVDADFFGGFNTAITEDLASACFRIGFVIVNSGFSITWTSKLQTEIALSAVEAEPIALSIALREIIPNVHLPKEISAVMSMPTCDKAIKCAAFEDNDSAIDIVKTQK